MKQICGSEALFLFASWLICIPFSRISDPSKIRTNMIYIFDNSISGQEGEIVELY